MILDEWLKKYESENKQSYSQNKDYDFMYLFSRGFMEYKFYRDMVKVKSIYGDYCFWLDLLNIFKQHRRLEFEKKINFKSNSYYNVKKKKEWIALYERKTQDVYELPLNFDELFLPNRGFAQYSFNNNSIIVYHTCGDGSFWRDVAEFLACRISKPLIRTILSRNPYVYLRAFNVVIDKTEWVLKDNYKCLQIYGYDQEGRLVFVSQQPNEYELYYVTQWV